MVRHIALPDRSAAVPAAVLVAFGLGALSAAVALLVALFSLGGLCFCGATWPLAHSLTLYGLPVHLASLAAGIVAGGCRREGSQAAFLAVLFGGVGAALSGLGFAALWSPVRL
jgi:hypothetical protein